MIKNPGVVAISLVFCCVTLPSLVAHLLFDVTFGTIHLILVALLVTMSLHSALGIPDLSIALGLVSNSHRDREVRVNEVRAVTLQAKSLEIGGAVAQVKEKEKDEVKKTDGYIGELDGRLNAFLQVTDLEKEPACADSKLWNMVLRQEKETYSIEVHKRVGCDFYFRVVVDLDASPEEAFDYMSNIDLRTQWDEICQAGGTVEIVSPQTRIQYMRTKGMWPTAPRDALVVAFFTKTQDGRYVNLTHSIDSHPAYKPIDGDVRMIAKMAGFIIGPHPSGEPKRCRLVQIMDGDLGGWLPKSIVAMITTQAFPISFRRANRVFRNTKDHRTVSEVIQVAQGVKALEILDIVPPNNQVSIEPPRSKKGLSLKSLEPLLKILEKAQPVLVALIFFILFFRRK